MTSNASVHNLLSFWIDFIEKNNRTAPILLLGNKLDVVVRDEELFIKNRIKRVANQIFRSSNVNLHKNYFFNYFRIVIRNNFNLCFLIFLIIAT